MLSWARDADESIQLHKVPRAFGTSTAQPGSACCLPTEQLTSGPASHILKLILSTICTILFFTHLRDFALFIDLAVSCCWVTRFKLWTETGGQLIDYH